MAGDDTLSKEERAAVKQRAAELKRQASRTGGSKREREAQDCLDAIAGLPEPDRAIAQMVHDVVTEVAPDLDPKTWYGFPSYARDGKVLVFYQQASKFGTRYGTLGFQDQAALDDGELWPASYALVGTSSATRERIAALVRRAAG
ncbi:hypothetical protein OVA14_05110 [Agrococcus sp. SL85]|uniref:iron chaperone n=1 Tax=Agrococcus sp. SL85 TaxID=2995141 RepID=UPI00226CC88A|nr:hypothetical protein [Agrococcus sp. SL85]WAC67128.1 hypothetical protein OVA14_05110 [Agrococcus sp. SL85]